MRGAGRSGAEGCCTAVDLLAVKRTRKAMDVMTDLLKLLGLIAKDRHQNHGVGSIYFFTLCLLVLPQLTIFRAKKGRAYWIEGSRQ